MNTTPSELTPEKLLQRIDWYVIRRLDGLLQGDYRSLFYGYGLDFADLREYQPEDDIRYIDWNVTARMNSPYIRQYVEDREITAWFLLDLSPSIVWGSSSVLKYTLLVEFVTTLARLLTRHGNRVGAILFDNHVDRMIPARSGRNHVLRLINDLMRESGHNRNGMTDLSALLATGLTAVKRRSLVFIVSDFLSVPGWERQLTLLSQRHEVLGIQLVDQSERVIPDIGLIVLEDAETGEQVYVDTHDRQFRERFRLEIERHEQTLRGVFRRSGVDLLTLMTGEDLVQSIVSFAVSRRKRSTRSTNINSGKTIATPSAKQIAAHP